MKKYIIEGVPTAQGRPRFTKRGITYDPNKKYKNSIAAQIMCQKPVLINEGPVKIRMVFNMPKPKSYSSKLFWHIKKPDIDNLIKAVLDALNGILWRDDSQISQISAQKIYVKKNEPNIELVVDALEV